MAETPETPTPSLAERIDERAEPGHVPIVGYSFAADLRAAAAQLRQLDRIKAAAGDARAVADGAGLDDEGLDDADINYKLVMVRI